MEQSKGTVCATALVSVYRWGVLGHTLPSSGVAPSSAWGTPVHLKIQLGSAIIQANTFQFDFFCLLKRLYTSASTLTPYIGFIYFRGIWGSGLHSPVSGSPGSHRTATGLLRLCTSPALLGTNCGGARSWACPNPRTEGLPHPGLSSDASQ